MRLTPRRRSPVPPRRFLPFSLSAVTAVCALVAAAPASAANAPSFAAAPTIATNLQPAGIATADINTDGRPDIVTANHQFGSGPAGTVTVSLNTTSTGASTPTFSPTHVSSRRGTIAT